MASVHARARLSGSVAADRGIALAPNAIEAATIRKVQTRIIPLVFFLFVIAFIDRINIGFAALTMNKALAITSQQFGLLSGIFFGAIFFSKYRATFCCTSSALACG